MREYDLALFLFEQSMNNWLIWRVTTLGQGVAVLFTTVTECQNRPEAKRLAGLRGKVEVWVGGFWEI
jgi:hypothetical protein